MGPYGRIIFAIIGFSSSMIFCLPTIKRRQAKHVAEERLRMINEAVERAEERIMTWQERHDRLLNQVCSYYLCHRELEEALIGSRKAVNDAFEFAATLRKMQLLILSSYPHAVDLSTTLD